jgi:hypothetical protein
MYLLEQAAAALVFTFLLERRDRPRLQSFLAALLLLAGCFAIDAASQYAYSGGGQPAEGSWSAGPAGAAVSNMVIVGIFIGLIAFIYRVSLMEAVYAEICAYLAEHMAYCIRILANWAAGRNVADGPEHFFYWAIHILVYLAAWFFFARKMIHKGHYFAAPLRTTVLLFYALSIIMAVSILASTYDFEPLHAVYALAFSGFALFSQLDRQRQLAELEESAVRQQLMIAQREQYELYRQNVSTVDRKCHDLRHQAGHLLKSAASDAQKEEIRSLMKDIMIYDSFIRTGCRDLDTILTQKNEVCRRKDIELTCIVDGKLLSFMDGADLFAVFDRVFEKAIGEAGILPKDLRRIRFHVAEKFSLISAAAEYPLPEGKKKYDDAGDSQFLRSLEFTLEKYDGFVQIRDLDGSRCIRITLQAP